MMMMIVYDGGHYDVMAITIKIPTPIITTAYYRWETLVCPSSA